MLRCVLQLKVKALVLDLIHNIDVVDQLVADGTTHIGQWQWQKQMRFYLNSKGKCVARMVDAEIVYTYEYQVRWLQGSFYSYFLRRTCWSPRAACFT